MTGSVLLVSGAVALAVPLLYLSATELDDDDCEPSCNDDYEHDPVVARAMVGTGAVGLGLMVLGGISLGAGQPGVKVHSKRRRPPRRMEYDLVGSSSGTDSTLRF